MRRTALLVTMLLAACRTAPTPIPVAGTGSDLTALAGEWAGEYSSRESGRVGTITFSLRAGTDTAFGDVFMIPRENWNPVSPVDAKEEFFMRARPERALTVRFVRVRGGAVFGTLEPYVAPDWDCLVVTTFTGRIAGDSVAGTYVTRDELGREQRGKWGVRRQGPGQSP